jgi:predicted DNA-binding transcriptional regulator YafY
MRADRLLSILLLMQVRRRVTAQELARWLEVSERTIYRDMEALREKVINQAEQIIAFYRRGMQSSFVNLDGRPPHI